MVQRSAAPEANPELAKRGRGVSCWSNWEMRVQSSPSSSSPLFPSPPQRARYKESQKQRLLGTQVEKPECSEALSPSQQHR